MSETGLGGRRLAVVGAGISGLACARVARDAGFQVDVYEKSRGVGGRLATRRPFGLEDAIGLDHGAPAAHCSARYPETAETLATLGAAAGPAWGDAAFIGVPGMSDLARPLAEGSGDAEGAAPLKLHLETEIAAIAAGLEDWLLRDANDQVHGPFDAVAVAVPAAQTRALLGEACPLAETDATYAPVMTLLAVFDPPPPGARLDDRIADPPAPLSSVHRVGAKPGRRMGGREAWVAHASRDWSERHKDTERDAIAAALRPALAAAIGAQAETEPAYLAGHRWLYAVVDQPVGRAYWISPETQSGPGPLGCCGDWRLGPNVGDALASGLRLGQAIVDRMRRDGA